MEEDEPGVCPACEDVMPDLVSLNCGHRPCKNCLTRHWESRNGHVCPLCWEESREFRARQRSDIVARNRFCSRHSSLFSLYCPEYEELICNFCQRGNEHAGHEHWRIQEAVRKCKEHASDCTKKLKEKVGHYKKAIVTLNEMTQCIKSQAQQMKFEIREEFEKLHCFLREDEKIGITRLTAEEEQKMQILKNRKKNIEMMTSEMIFDLDAMRMLEYDQEAEDLDYLQNYSCAMRRTWHDSSSSESSNSLVDLLIQQIESFFISSRKIPDTISARLIRIPWKPELNGGLIDVAKHLRNLKYGVWERMLPMVQHTPVTLDPNTAAPCLYLSEGMTSVSYSADPPQLPDNPERFTYGAEMLGSQGFTSGRHRWEVEVGNNTNWAVGVAKQSVERKHTIVMGRKIEREAGILALHCKDGRYRTEMGPISIQTKLCRVRVELDCDLQRVTFSDPVRNRSLFTHWPLTRKPLYWNAKEPLFPYFSNSCQDLPLRIAPEKVTITVGPPKRRIFLIFLWLAFFVFILFVYTRVLIHVLKEKNTQ